MGGEVDKQKFRSVKKEMDTVIDRSIDWNDKKTKRQKDKNKR